MAQPILAAQDPQVATAIDQELERQRSCIELIASENFTSPAVMEAVGSVLTNKYAEGYPGKRYYGGCEKVDIVEDLARDVRKSCSSADSPTFSPTVARMRILAAYAATVELGDTILAFRSTMVGTLPTVRR